MEAILKEISADVKELLVTAGRTDERVKSLENTRKWIFGIMATVTAAVIISAII